MNKKELLDHIDSTVDSMVDEILKYAEDSIKEKKKDKFFKNFMSDKMLKWNEDLYDFDPEDVELGDIVFGTVYGDDIKSARYPFKVIYKSEDKLILQGIKNTNKKYNFVQACNLKWDVKLMVNEEVKTWMHSTIISKEIVDKYNLDSLLSKQNLAVGFHYWTESRYNSSNAWLVYSDGNISYNATSNTLGALPYVIIDL